MRSVFPRVKTLGRYEPLMVVELHLLFYSTPRCLESMVHTLHFDHALGCLLNI